MVRLDAVSFGKRHGCLGFRNTGIESACHRRVYCRTVSGGVAGLFNGQRSIQNIGQDSHPETRPISHSAEYNHPIYRNTDMD